jgi:glycosyltransferase involved in cell wall biosynthesis
LPPRYLIVQPTGLIYLSAIPWAFTRHREHEIARGLANVLPTLFVNPPVVRPLRTGPCAPPTQVAEGLWALDTVAPTPGYRNAHLINLWVRRGLARQIRAACAQLGIQRPVLVVDDVGYLPILGALDSSLLVFDCVDRPWAFAKVASVRLLKRYFYGVARRADLVLASSRNLHEELSQLNPNVHLSLNAGDFDHFARAAEPGLQIPEDLAPIPCPRLTTMGWSFAPRTDYNLVHEAALLHPEWHFVFVGTTILPPGFVVPPNMHMLGERDYATLPAYIAHSQVCLAAYKIGVGWDYAFPKKLFEYLAAGKPSVIVPLPEVLPYADWVHTPRDTDEFVSAIEQCLAEYEDGAVYQAAATRRQALARENTWDRRVADVTALLQDALGRRKGGAPGE